MKAAHLCIVVRLDLPLGYRVAQAVHGADAFRDAHPEEYRRWHEESNTVAVLGAVDEDHLVELFARAPFFGVPAATFEEPDLAGSTTVLVLGPHPATHKLTGPLPLL